MKKNMTFSRQNITKAALCIALITGSAGLAGCSAGAQTDASTNSETATEKAIRSIPNEVASFVFSESGITTTAEVSGFEIDGTTLNITEAGTYSVTGSCSDGQIVVKKGVTGVNLVLDGIDLTSQKSAAISCNKSSEATIVVSENTINTLADTEQNNDETNANNEGAENAVIKCKDGSKVTFSGSGELNIVANGKNGIKSGATTDTEGEASLTIKDAIINITANVNDAINAGQTLKIESSSITIDAKDDALHSDYDLTIGNASSDTLPTITINSSYEGIEASNLVINSGDITINSSDDCMNAANYDLNNYDFQMTINGGNINAYTSSGDGFDSNGSINITGGNVFVETANRADNQPLDADGQISITGGTVLAIGNSSGMGMNLNATQAYLLNSSNSSSGALSKTPSSSEGANQMYATSENTITIANNKGAEIACYTAKFAPSYIFYTSPELANGETYSITTEGNTQNITATTDSISSSMGGAMQNGGSPSQGGAPSGQIPIGEPNNQGKQNSSQPNMGKRESA